MRVLSLCLEWTLRFDGGRGGSKTYAVILEADGKVTSETRHFALSWMPTPEALLTTARDHWAIENVLHWQLDFSFRETIRRHSRPL